MAKLDNGVGSSKAETAAKEPPRKAYSYLRFSTPEQMEGDSFRRQTDLAAKYASEHGLELDSSLTYHDFGVSAFDGSNVTVGRFSEFREAVRVGLVPRGSWLLVESLDRISRDHAFDAQTLLSQIISDGIVIVTLIDGRVYSLAELRKDPLGMIYSIMGFMRANEESATKSRRLREAWHHKRVMMRERVLTSKAPAWLQLDRAAGRFTLVPERAATVRRIFAMTLDGVGQHKIAETFNQEGLPTWGRAKHWQRSYIAKILANPAVIGTITPHTVERIPGEKDKPARKRRQPAEPVYGYYPAVISQETWAEALALRGERVVTAKMAPITNILAGLARCPKCGRTMTRVQKGKKSLPSFVCTAAKAGAGCEYKSVRYQWVEDRLLRVLPDMIRDREGLEEVEEVEDRIAVLRDLIQACRDQIEDAVDALLGLRSPALAERLRSLENELPGLQAELAALEGHREVMAGPLVGSRIEKAIAALQAPEGGELDRSLANVTLRSLFYRAVINWPEGTIDLEWKAGGTCRVQYASVAFQPVRDASSRAALCHREPEA